MQFRQRDKEAIARGDLTLTIRRWRTPQARVGGRYRVGEHVIEVTSVDQIEPSAISLEDARAAGHESAEAALDAIRRNQRKSGDANAPLYRVAFRCMGEQVDPRKVLAADSNLDDAEVVAITERLAKMDSRARQGPWTRAALEAIAIAPGRRAAELAAEQGRETAKFKADIRKLKALGLTISLEVGYELSPRGQVVLDAIQNADD
ncbi:MAG: hypothetical protein OXG27_01190 [Chloroflexi bacterium]|nr:hypothetical protein [Chloroflexota bacterium]